MSYLNAIINLIEFEQSLRKVSDPDSNRDIALNRACNFAHERTESLIKAFGSRFGSEIYSLSDLIKILQSDISLPAARELMRLLNLNRIFDLGNPTIFNFEKIKKSFETDKELFDPIVHFSLIQRINMYIQLLNFVESNQSIFKSPLSSNNLKSAFPGDDNLFDAFCLINTLFFINNKNTTSIIDTPFDVTCQNIVSTVCRVVVGYRTKKGDLI
jgi:hypothetical protein